MNPFGHKEIPSLTPLRGIAALAVFTFHCIAFYLPATKAALVAQGCMESVARFSLAVDFFFILSGFLLYTLYQSRFSTLQAGTMLDFWLRRFARIYPLLLITSTAAFLLYRVDSPRWETWKWISDLSLMNSVPRYFPPLNSPSWSISAEWMAYLWAPWLFCVMGRMPRRLWLPVLVGSYLLLDYLVLAKWHTLDSRTALRGICGFSIGAALAAARITLSPRTAKALFLASAAALILILFGTDRTLISDLVAYLCTIGIIVPAPWLRGWVGRALNSAPVEWLGLVSYSLYLWHPVVFHIFHLGEYFGWVPVGRSIAGDAVAFAFLLVVTLYLCSWSYRLIEIQGRIVTEAFLRRLLKSVGWVAPARPASK